MWSSRNRSKMMLLLTTQHYRQLAVIVTFAAFAMQTFTMAAAQNLALSSTTPKLVNGGALATAASNPLSNCSIVRSLFESQGINGADIPQQPITGKFLCFFLSFFYLFLLSITTDSDSFSKYQAYVYLFIWSVGRSLHVGCFSNKLFLFLDGSNSIAYSKISFRFCFPSLFLSIVNRANIRISVFPFQAILCMKRSVHSFSHYFFAPRSLHLLSHFLSHIVIACICCVDSVQIPEKSRMRVNTKFDFILV